MAPALEIALEVACSSRRVDLGVETKAEDVARLSPLGHENINFLGRCSFALAESVARGELRPLHDPEETGSQAGPYRGLTRLSVPMVVEPP